MFAKSQKGHISELVAYSGFYIGPEIQANGQINTDEDVYIDGRFTGEISTEGVVELGKNASFKGTIKARSVILEGQAKAVISATESIVISGCGQLIGSAQSKNISVDSGALLKADLTAGSS